MISWKPGGIPGFCFWHVMAGTLGVLGTALTSVPGYVKIRGRRACSRVLCAREQLIRFPHGQELSEGERLQLLWHIAVRNRLLQCKSGTV